MTRPVLILCALLAILVGIEAAHADVFASHIRITNPDGSAFDGSFSDGTGAKISYILNDTATAVVVEMKDVISGLSVATLSASHQGKGLNSVSWNGSGAVAGKKYVVAITATQPAYSSTEYTVFNFIPTYENEKNIFTRGVDAQRDMTMKTFGYLYAANSDVGSETRLRTGILRYNADGSYAGTANDDPMLVSTLGVQHAGGSFDYGSTAPWYATLDAQGRIYVSGNGTGQVFRIDSDTSHPKTIIRGLGQPRGLCAVGKGSSFELYIATDTIVVRAKLGTDDTLRTPIEVVARFNDYVRDVAIDDAGYLITALRKGAAGAAPGYIERYSLAGTLPVGRTDAVLSLEFPTGQPVGLALKHGPNTASAADDTLYASVRGGSSTDTATIGIHELTGFESFISETRHIFVPAQITPPSIGGNISANADLTVDYAGNVILFENGNEEIIMLSPPHDTPSISWTIRGYDTLNVLQAGTTGIDESVVPAAFVVHQNYPNPFNPTTQIGFDVPRDAEASVVVYDLLGNEVKALYQGAAGPGYHAVVWDATNNAGSRVASGPYLYRVRLLAADGTVLVQTRRMLLVK